MKFRHLAALLLAPLTAWAAYPSMTTLKPHGGQIGADVKLTITGAQLDDFEDLTHAVALGVQLYFYLLTSGLVVFFRGSAEVAAFEALCVDERKLLASMPWRGCGIGCARLQQQPAEFLNCEGNAEALQGPLIIIGNVAVESGAAKVSYLLPVGLGV